MSDTLPLLTLVFAMAATVLLVVLLLRDRGGARAASDEARASREELSRGFSSFGQNVATQMTSIATVQNNQIDAFAQQLAAMSAATESRLEAFRATLDESLGRVQGEQQASAKQGRESIEATLDAFRKSLEENLGRIQDQQRLSAKETRDTLESRLEKLQQDNAAKLEQMRATVDEKLHATLELRLSESFKVVSERLELVHKGLGEMQALAQGVGDLKKVLVNVRNRGVLGEVQLAAILEQMLTPEQYAANVQTKAGSRERVEFAVRMPGRGDVADVVWLPIDAKFPIEDYQRLQDAQEAADPVAVELASKALEARLRLEAKSIAEKYVEPPGTTDFALLFLPLEGLYAEALRRPGLFEALQRDHRVTICGPTTLSAILNSLQMGFRTLAIEKRSGEVWKVLGMVKAEFGKFGETLARTKAQLQTVANTIEQAEVRTRQIERKLRDVEVMPAPGEVPRIEE